MRLLALSLCLFVFSGFCLGSEYLNPRCDAFYSYSGESKTNVTKSSDLIQQEENGSVAVSSTPESGMIIYLNGKNTGKVTPANLEMIAVGTHVIRLESQWYQTQEKTVTVASNQVVRIDFSMVGLFAQLTVNTNQNAMIYIDGAVKGQSSWKGRVKEGIRRVKVEKTGFVSREWDITIVRGKDQVIDLMMQPKMGSLEVITEPSNAMISLDGRLYGMSPKIIPDLLPGSYNLTIERPGYTSITKRIQIHELVTTKEEFVLYSGKMVTIITDPPGAYLVVEDDTLGVTPIEVLMHFGKNIFKLIRGDEVVVESLDIHSTSKKDYTYVLRRSNDPFEKSMVFVKGGTFRMGDTFNIGNKEAKPVHEVTVSDFYIGKYEVTQAQWKFIMGENPSHYPGCDSCPVERVSWLDVQTFIKKLNELTEKNYRLPTEAEWEYAARGGTNSQGYRYSGGNNINFVSWYSGNSKNKPQPVGTMRPNELGIHDMSGNVWEWCIDWFGDFTKDPKVNPAGPEKGFFRVVKGGSWFGYAGGNIISSRGSDDPENKRSYIGFRLAASP